MKILAIDFETYHASARLVYRALHERGIAEVTLLAPSGWREHGRAHACEPEPSALPVLPVPGILEGRHHRWMIPGLVRRIRREQPDILLVNTEPENHLAVEITAQRWRLPRRCRIVLTSWRNIEHRAAGFPYKFDFLHQWSDRYALRQIDHLIVRNQDGREIFASYGFEKTTLIPLPVDVSLFRPSPRLVDGVFRIGFIGRLIPEKGVDDLLRAFAMLDPASRLMIVGEGKEEHRLHALARSLGVESRVEWNGPAMHTGVASLYSMLDVLALPSRTRRYWREQFGRVLVEAMACGVPVVGSDSGEIPRVISGVGRIFPEGDVAALAGHLRTLMEFPSLRGTLAEAGLARVRSQFTLDQVLPKYQKLFSDLV